MDEIIEQIAVRVVHLCLPELRSIMIDEVKRTMYPLQIKGNELAGRMLGITSEALTMRLSRGVYVEGVHYKKKSDRIYLWNRDALLETEYTLKGKNGFKAGIKRA